MPAIHRLLIANRGEIARRIGRSARALGIAPLGVYTSADRGSPLLLEVDEAVELPSYLDIPALIAAARRMRAQAVHPGFGFLAENAAFAQAVLDAGLLWVGPPPSAISAMGSKAEARQRVAAAGVPVVPGYDGLDQSEARFTEEAHRMGFPVLVKASAGGGGKGMQVVRSAAELGPALEAARRLAQGAFADPRLILERYIERPRHVEVQVLGDQHGALLHLFERECSIQRRHQKVLEEAPSPAFAGPDGPPRRQALLQTALSAAAAVGYQSAGTVEMILDSEGRGYFLEMNTRLQVEHPVTELVTGLDIVALQLRVAEGRPLGLRQEQIHLRGHAMEARLYAEDPARGYLPCTGPLLRWEPARAEGLRVDSGVESGVEVGVDYDPMLAKFISWGEDREEARRRLIFGLEHSRALGLTTNQAWLAALLSHPAYTAGALHTGFLDEHRPEAAPLDPALAALLALAAEELGQTDPRLSGLRPRLRTNPWAPAPRLLRVGDQSRALSWTPLGPGHGLASGERWAGHDPVDGLPAEGPAWIEGQLEISLLQPAPELRLRLGDRCLSAAAHRSPEGWWIQVGAASALVQLLPDLPPPQSQAEQAGGCLAPMPGKVVRLLVSAGETVAAGQGLLILEAMKMEQLLRAPEAGQVQRLRVAEGDRVEAGQRLVDLGPPPDEAR